MSKLKLNNGTTYNITDCATQNDFVIELKSLEDISGIISELTDENMSEIQFLTDTESATGIYQDKTFVNAVITKTNNGHLLAIHITNKVTAHELRLAECEAALAELGVKV